MAATERYNLFVGTLIVTRIKNYWWLPTKPQGLDLKFLQNQNSLAQCINNLVSISKNVFNDKSEIFHKSYPLGMSLV